MFQVTTVDGDSFFVISDDFTHALWDFANAFDQDVLDVVSIVRVCELSEVSHNGRILGEAVKL